MFNCSQEFYYGGTMKKKDLYDIALDEMHLQDKRQQEKRDQEVKEKNKGEKDSPSYEYQEGV